jgi:di/tricarboxylate transporter
MYLIHGLILGLIVLAIVFFIVLPITDARTARMKLSVAGGLCALLAISVAAPHLTH